MYDTYGRSVRLGPAIDIYTLSISLLCYGILDGSHPSGRQAAVQKLDFNEIFEVTGPSRISPLYGNFYSAYFTGIRSEEHTSELQSRGHLVCRLLLEKKNIKRE